MVQKYTAMYEREIAAERAIAKFTAHRAKRG